MELLNITIGGKQLEFHNLYRIVKRLEGFFNIYDYTFTNFEYDRVTGMLFFDRVFQDDPEGRNDKLYFGDILGWGGDE